MSNLLFAPVESRNRDEKRITSRFFPQGSGAVVNANNVGSGMTFTRGASAGLFTVVFEEACPGFIGAHISIGHATLVLHARTISIQTDSAGACTGFTFQVYTSAVSATISDVTAAATSWICVEAILLNSRDR